MKGNARPSHGGNEILPTSAPGVLHRQHQEPPYLKVVTGRKRPIRGGCGIIAISAPALFLAHAGCLHLCECHSSPAVELQRAGCLRMLPASGTESPAHPRASGTDRKSTRLNSSHLGIS